MDFRTNLPVSQAPFTLTHAHRLFVMGSCFAEQTGQRLRESGFRTVVNPFGVLYNPVSIEQAINRLLAHKTYEADELVVHEGLYQSFDHHGSFSNVHAEKALADINHAFRNAVEGLETADCLILTLGTAWLYKRVDTNKVVANCHKWPATFFIRERLDVDAFVETFSQLIGRLLTRRPGLKIILTVSPIRHIKDGLHANNLSKAVLLLGIETLCQRFESVTYYPAYELLLDDLRDYRFFADDLLHPSALAQTYIWEHFTETFFSKGTREMARQVQAIHKAMEHRPFHPKDEAYRRFAQKNLAAIEGLSLSEPALALEDERAFFERIIRDY
jgi:hypothetical protein